MEAATNGAARSASLARAAESMLRALGGGEVRLRLPLATADPDRAALGLETSAAEEVALAPAIVRPLAPREGSGGRRFELLLPAARLQAIADQRGASAQALLQAALGIAHRDQLLHLEQVSAETFAEMPYLYRVIAVLSA